MRQVICLRSVKVPNFVISAPLGYMSIPTLSSLFKGGRIIRHGCYFSSSYSKWKAWNIWQCKKQQQLTKESFRIPKDQSAADNNWGNTALEFVRYKSNTFEYMYVKRWNSKTRSQWGTCTFFGSDTIILGLSSSRYDKNASLLCIAINVVFLDSCNKLTHFNCIFSF